MTMEMILNPIAKGKRSIIAVLIKILFPPYLLHRKLRKVRRSLEKLAKGNYRVGNPQGGHESALERCSVGILAPAKWKNIDEGKVNTAKQACFPDANQLEGTNCNIIAEKKINVKVSICRTARTLLVKGDGGFSSAKSLHSQDASRNCLNAMTLVMC